MQLLSHPTLLFLTSCFALLPFHGLAQPRRSNLQRANLPDLSYPPNHDAATCPRDSSNTLRLSFVPDTTTSANILSQTKSNRAVVVPRAQSGALPDVCRQIASFFFPAIPYRFLNIGFPRLLPGNVYLISIRTPAGKRIDTISARVVVGTGPAQDRLLGTSKPMSNVGTLRITVQAQAEVSIGVIFEEGNTPGEIAMFALGTVQLQSPPWPIRGATFVNV